MMDEIVIEEIHLDELPAPLHLDDSVDGVLWLDDGVARHVIPFGEDIPDSGAKNKPYAVWSWDGDAESPTLSPSIDISRFHIWIQDGEVQA